MTACERIREARRQAEYRASIRRTMQAFSDQALAFQNARISLNDCIDRQEVNREIARRAGRS